MSKVQGREGKKRMDPREHVHRGEKKSYYKSHHRCRWKNRQPGHSERTGGTCSEWRKHSPPQMLHSLGRSVRLDPQTWQWGVPDDPWGPGATGVRVNSRELTTNGKWGEKVCRTDSHQASGMFVKICHQPLLAKHVRLSACNHFHSFSESV